MKQASTRIQCPNCGTSIDVNDVLYHQLDDELKRKYEDERARDKKAYAEQARQLESEREELARDKAAVEQAVADQLKEKLGAETARISKEISRRLEDEQSEKIKAIEAELEEKAAKVRELNKAQADLARMKREAEELKQRVELETEQRVTDRLNSERERIRKEEEGRSSLQLAEREKIIDQLKNQLSEAQRKAEQGSSQLQGEVMELAIEDWLAQEFPLDTIEEIKKGAQGADCVQIVNSRQHSNCGTIYYESKRAKNFSPAWIEKFKADIRDRRADVGVLVTAAMPADMARMGLKDGVWVCSFDEFKGLSVVLRQSLINLHSAVAAEDNKGDKMTMLYGFLTSNEFRMQIEAIVEGFTQMQTELDSEKRAMQSIWKKREKQIEKVLLNTNNMYSSIRGIAGSAIQAVPQLELPAPDDDDATAD